MPLIPLPLVIIAGGKSSRMGSDKALLPFGGFKTLTEFQLHRLKPYFSRLHVSAKNSEKFAFEASFIDDNPNFADHSPLVALLSILEQLQTPVCVLSVDTPFVTPEIFETLYKNFEEGDDAIVATSPCASHQLCAIYAPSIVKTIRAQLAKNEHKIRSVFSQSRTKFIAFESDEPFFNLNHPDEYQKAQELL
ncbi:molybdenum cofactor guanylyltransferase [Sulfurospirillum multivorans]|uniref:Probable molybdenum cofactor guanylyltransferase n=2 Tax=Sulfurospirillum multivorans TaxID=66821 RepID=A0AA86E0W5_SULMK|nr:molybdenum cofactor guanylyltransferase [Sulfurospirillum multivorans]AHJ14455.1 molybdenum cofactor guanylyltransferase MobA [Sulfurospirillum multivorans DSM 12446]QEH07940.1 molybdenum cofactor guanylyltransferase MobA [Sulfurospirillum multivorans]